MPNHTSDNQNNAYERWSEHDDSKLKSLSRTMSVSKLATYFQRTTGAIRRRLNKLFSKNTTIPVPKETYQCLKIIQDRKIKKLIHFTSEENIINIRKHGLLSIKKLKEKNIEYRPNDPERWDRLPNFISTSITDINHFLLKQFKDRCKATKWMIIELSPKLLVSKKCLFFDANAASSKFKNVRRNLNTAEAFEGMFASKIPYKSRILERNGKEENQPTNVQAEICVEESIEPKYFKEIRPVTPLEKML